MRLSNGAIANDIERPVIQISRSRSHYRCPRRIVCAADERSVCYS